MTLRQWDRYFYTICDAVSSNSKCHSRHIGAILVRDKSIVSTGYNGPPRDIAHCDSQCPRRQAGHGSGEGLHLCPAIHAEVNCVVNAARQGVITLGTILYMNCIIPCNECLKVLINAGVVEVVIRSNKVYSAESELTTRLIEESGIKVREFSHL